MPPTEAHAVHNRVKNKRVSDMAMRRIETHKHGSMRIEHQKLKRTDKSAHADTLIGTVHLEVWDLVAVHLEVNLKLFSDCDSISI